MGNDVQKLAGCCVSCGVLRVATGDAPSSREAAAAVALSDTELLMFGGGTAGGCVRVPAVVSVQTACCADLNVCNVCLRRDDGGALQFADVWCLKVPAEGGTASWRRVETHGDAPCARTGCVALLPAFPRRHPFDASMRNTSCTHTAGTRWCAWKPPVAGARSCSWAA
jgi:hypothetical protein